jgi:hypothetical protein
MKPSTPKIIKSLVFLALLLPAIPGACRGEEIPARRFMVTVGLNLFQSPSSGYRQLYGKTAPMPEIKITSRFYKNVSVWAAYGQVTDDGFVEEVDETINIRRSLFGFGFGYVQKISAPLRLRGEIGLAYISYKENALQVVQKGAGLGWKIGADLDYFIGERLFVTLAAAYSEASDEVETGKIKLGGLQAGVGLGFTF